ncbi:hypothetical protein ACILG0_16970 [Pseudomonadota bacterium AL_CKDN230030165-1A_HGKHYDSX7]
MTPEDFEIAVRSFASLKWTRQCIKETIAGIQIDGVIRLEENHFILLQITKNETLNKFRKDILDLELIRRKLFDDNYIVSECFLITEDDVSSLMAQTVAEKKMKTMRFEDFKRDFFDYSSYRYERSTKPFGSAVDPLTGEIDKNSFIKVNYSRQNKLADANFHDVKSLLQSGKIIILKGEYGTGKSRLIQSLFEGMSSDLNEFILAIDLRDYKGVQSSDELIRRHLKKLGLGPFSDAGVKCLNSGLFTLLIDGFDEVAIQTWSELPQKIVDIRFREFGFIREIISNSKKGILITGREHFFNDDDEMIRAFGLQKGKYEILETKGEFTDAELNQFQKENNINLVIPKWFPKKPMAIRLLSENGMSDDIEHALKLNNPYFFWISFFQFIAERDSAANKSVLDPEAIKRLLVAIGRFTRNTPTDSGPVSIESLNSIFKAEFGFDAIEESAAYLQRLPGMGRIEADSYDRRFTDEQFLDFLRVQAYAADLDRGSFLDDDIVWKNTLSKGGILLLAALLVDREIDTRSHLHRLRNKKNVNLKAELVSSAVYDDSFDEIDFQGLRLDGFTSSYVDFSNKRILNLEIINSYIYEFNIQNSKLENVILDETHISKIFGVSSRVGFEKYLSDSCIVENFEQVSSISKIKQTKLNAAQQYLVLMIQKVFNQKGAGRKEEVLVRGFNGIYNKKLAYKIINLLEREGILISHAGDEGKIFKGNRKHQPRAERILEELSLSQDDLWKKVSALDDH